MKRKNRILYGIVGIILFLGMIISAIPFSFLCDTELLTHGLDYAKSQEYRYINECYAGTIMEAYQTDSLEELDSYFALRNMEFQYGIIDKEITSVTQIAGVEDFVATNMTPEDFQLGFEAYGTKSNRFVYKVFPKECNFIFEEDDFLLYSHCFYTNDREEKVTVVTVLPYVIYPYKGRMDMLRILFDTKQTNPYIRVDAGLHFLDGTKGLILTSFGVCCVGVLVFLAIGVGRLLKIMRRGFGKCQQHIRKEWKKFSYLLAEKKSMVTRFLWIWIVMLAITLLLLVFSCNDGNLDFGLPSLALLGLELITGFVAVRFLRQLADIQTGMEKLAIQGERVEMDTANMQPDLQKMAQNLNSIGEGTEIAVAERIKSERFKAELITNVSHDIKTPLTSIINYVDLLSQEEIASATAQEYMEVLKRQSFQLKKLIEDLVEASKASSGAITVQKEELDLTVFLSQVVGEYEDRLKGAELSLVLEKPQNPVWVEIDGRHLWRVLDNLLHNVCKYALPGSRVYLSLTEDCTIIMKNISKYPLNISAKELMERFVRGDDSRHTEGHGLGLSIAKSLIELMDGEFELQVDGDLFKVSLFLSK